MNIKTNGYVCIVNTGIKDWTGVVLRKFYIRVFTTTLGIEEKVKYLQDSISVIKDINKNKKFYTIEFYINTEGFIYDIFSMRKLVFDNESVVRLLMNMAGIDEVDIIFEFILDKPSNSSYSKKETSENEDFKRFIEQFHWMEAA